MAYIGRGIDNISQIEVLDLITFTDSAGPYNILKGAVAFIPSTVNSLLIEVDGIIQAPASYTVDGSTITFGVSMSSSSTMNSMIHFGTGLITTPADGSVTAAKIASDAVTTAKILDNNVTVAKLPTTLDISGNTVTLPASVSGLGTGITNAQLAGSIDVTSKITGVVPTANLGSGSASASTYLAGDQSYKTISEYDDDAIRDDIAILALHQATNANAAKYNLINTNVDQYEDSTGISSFTDCVMDSTGEYVSCLSTSDSAETGATTDDLVTSTNTQSKNADSNWAASSGWQHFGQQFYVAPRHRLRIYAASWVSYGTGGSMTSLMNWIDTDTNDEPTNLPYAATQRGAISYNSTAGTWIGGVWNSGGPYWEIDNRANTTNMKMWLVLSRESPGAFGGGMQSGYTFSGSPAQGTYKGTGGADNTTTPMGFSTGMYSTSSGVTEALDDTSDVVNWRVKGTYVKRTETINATGNYISTATTANSSVSSVGGVITYSNEAGTNTLNTDIILEVSADGGSNYSTCVLEAGGTFATGILQASAPAIAVTPGTSIQYRLSFANQSASKEARIKGASLMY